jgi:hypothetical protein
MLADGLAASIGRFACLLSTLPLTRKQYHPRARRRKSMTPLVKQPSPLPTNKLAVAVLIGPAATEAWGAVMAQIYLPMSGPEVSMLVGGLAALAVGYIVRDRVNV